MPTAAASTPKPEKVDKDVRQSRSSAPLLRPAGSSAMLDLAPKIEIDLSAPPRTRPLVGKDIVDWREANRLERMQIAQMLAMPSPNTYLKLTRGQGGIEPLPLDLEMLLRFYMRHPVRTEVRRPVEIFEKIYGDLLRHFEGTPSYEPARVMLYSRFGAMLGRTVFSVYRWFKAHEVWGSHGSASGPLRRLFSMLPDDAAMMRAELEELARATFAARGYDFEKIFPLPSTSNPPAPRRRGRVRRVVQDSPKIAPEAATVSVDAKSQRKPRAATKRPSIKSKRAA